MRSEGKEPCRLGVAKVTDETDLAIEVEIDGWLEWVPKSVLHDLSEVWKEGQEPGELVVESWWAEKGDRSARPAPTPIDEWEKL